MRTSNNNPLQAGPASGQASASAFANKTSDSRTKSPFSTAGIPSLAELEDALSTPSSALVEAMARLHGDILLLGVGGKIGPTLARMARRAADAAGSPKRVIGVSRFTSAGCQEWLKRWDIETLGGDLLDVSFVRSLPNVDNVLYLVGRKFGANGDAAQTWALNAYLPGLIADRFSNSRVVALSTGNVYGFSPVNPGRGAAEIDDPDPQGEYAMSVLGRERVFEYFSRARGMPTAIIRLNYATELRYGVLVDLAQKVQREEPISLEMGYFNSIWQRDACDMILRSFEHAGSPPQVLNVTGPECISCRETCERFGVLLERSVKFVGSEADTALLSDARQAIKLFGPPTATVQDMTNWIADWIRRGGEIWDKPTRFEVRNGKF
jgi:nucleoside-diphosphate-sugar epimerase